MPTVIRQIEERREEPNMSCGHLESTPGLGRAPPLHSIRLQERKPRIDRSDFSNEAGESYLKKNFNYS